jgi:hypothetical protein
MAQFDSLIIFPLLWSLLLTLIFHYNVLLNTIIPNFFGVKKFREKKLNSPAFYNFLNSNLGVKVNNSYNFFS